MTQPHEKGIKMLQDSYLNIVEGGAHMYAIIKTGGKQYQVEEGKVISVEKLIAEQGDEVTFDDVLLVSGEDVKIGKPNVEGAKVVGVVLEQGKEAKIRIFKYKAKSNYRRRQGHRQPFTKVQIKKIEG
jgi:large subunit ribosomal protein L21